MGAENDSVTVPSCVKPCACAIGCTDPSRDDSSPTETLRRCAEAGADGTDTGSARDFVISKRETLGAGWAGWEPKMVGLESRSEPEDAAKDALRLMLPRMPAPCDGAVEDAEGMAGSDSDQSVVAHRASTGLDGSVSAKQ